MPGAAGSGSAPADEPMVSAIDPSAVLSASAARIGLFLRLEPLDTICLFMIVTLEGACWAMDDILRRLRPAGQSGTMQSIVAFFAIEGEMLDFLPTFVAVAEAGSFAKVAREEGVAVSSVTR